MLGYLVSGLSLGFYAAVTPGPLQAFLLSQTLKNGWKRTLPASLAPLLSDLPIVTLVLLVLTQTPDWFLNALQIIGGFFIFYLGWNALSAVRAEASTTPVEAESIRQGVFKAALMNFISPNPYIFWSLIAGPIFLEGWRQAPVLGASFVLGFYGTLVGGFAGFVLLSAGTKQLGTTVTRILSVVSAVALFVFGAYQIWDGIRSWLA